MANTFTLVATNDAPDVCQDELKQAVLAVGPKEVQTPNMTVVAHDLKTVHMIEQKCKAASFIPTMFNLAGCSTGPKPGAYKRNGCGCE